MEIARIVNELSELQEMRKNNEEKKIVFTSGCFDLLHYGHICHLKESRELGDFLIVAVNSDASIKRLKGNSKPILSEKERISILQTLRYVDAVFLFDEDDVCNYFDIIKPDFFTIGAESAIIFSREIDVAKMVGSKVHIIKRIDNVSSTNIIEKIRGNQL